MPTGYTAHILDGEEEITFADFALLCSRAFLIQLREHPMDKPLPEKFEPGTYHSEALEKAEAELVEARAWTEEEADTAAQAAYDREVQSDKDYQARTERARERLEKILADAEAWEPPTERHRAIKEFMVNQIKDTIDHDGTPSSYRTSPSRLTGAQFKEARIQAAHDDVERHKAEQAKAEERAREANEWLAALRESLGVS